MRPPAVAVVWWLLLAAALAVVLLAFPRLGVAPRALAVAIVVLAAVDAAHFARGYNPIAPDDRAFPAPPAAVEFLQERAGTDRVAGIGVTLPPDSSTVYGIRDVRGNGPSRPELRFMRLFRLVNPGQSSGDWLAIPALDARGKRVLDALNVRWLVLPPARRNPGSPAWSRCTPPRTRRSIAAPRRSRGRSCRGWSNEPIRSKRSSLGWPRRASIPVVTPASRERA